MKKRALILVFISFLFLFLTAQKKERNELVQTISTVLRKQIIEKANRALTQQPITVTAESSMRSAGGKHDFYSEGDYWWPDPKNPDSPYIQRDGMTNPENFTAHRLAMIRFSEIVGSLASAYRISGDDKYARHALRHATAWFTDTATRMNPNLLYAQAIKGRVTGRGIGIIDAIQLMEVVKGLQLIERRLRQSDVKLFSSYREWFTRYLEWVTTHKYGIDEMNALNNHGTCWVMQVAVFASFTRNEKILAMCRDRYKNILLPNQMAVDGSFPLETRRTKPYGYSIFNLDAMATICKVLSTSSDNLWNYQTSDGKSIRKGIEFLHPYIVDKSKWPFAKDVMYWDNWPVAQPFLLFGAAAYSNGNWFDSWQKLEHAPTVDEVIRNLPVRNPLIWFD